MKPGAVIDDDVIRAELLQVVGVALVANDGDDAGTEPLGYLNGGATDTPVCAGNCGEDGCGGSCGTCTGTDICDGADDTCKDPSAVAGNSGAAPSVIDPAGDVVITGDSSGFTDDTDPANCATFTFGSKNVKLIKSDPLPLMSAALSRSTGIGALLNITSMMSSSANVDR